MGVKTSGPVQIANNPLDNEEPHCPQTPSSSSPRVLPHSPGGRTILSIVLSRDNIFHLKQSCKCHRLRQRRSTIALTIRITNSRTTCRGSPYHESLASVDGPPVTIAEVEFRRDVCVHPVPFARYGRMGVVWARVGGLLGLAGEIGLEGSGYG